MGDAPELRRERKNQQSPVALKRAAARERDGRINENSRRFCRNSAQNFRLHSPADICSRCLSPSLSLPFLSTTDLPSTCCSLSLRHAMIMYEMKLEELINKLREVGEDLDVWLAEHLTK
ncbi:Uncharacterized protein Rs2_22166 [Raphanus sativus]|nr:Uncharacterized protein Rs2_22166 [Raphanus sativus]